MGMPTSIVATIAEIVSAALVTIVYGGNYYEASVVDASLGTLEVDDVVVCESLPLARQWLVSAVRQD